MVMTVSDIQRIENKAVNTLPNKLNVRNMAETLCRDSQSQDFPGGTVVQNLPSNAGVQSLVLIAHAAGQLSPHLNY